MPISNETMKVVGAQKPSCFAISSLLAAYLPNVGCWRMSACHLVVKLALWACSFGLNSSSCRHRSYQPSFHVRSTSTHVSSFAFAARGRYSIALRSPSMAVSISCPMHQVGLHILESLACLCRGGLTCGFRSNAPYLNKGKDQASDVMTEFRLSSSLICWMPSENRPTVVFLMWLRHLASFLSTPLWIR